MDDLTRLCCQNSDRAPHGRRDAGTLSVRERYGKQDHIRLLYGTACKARFSGPKGTPLFDRRTPEDEAHAGPDHLAEGNGIRQAGRRVGVHRDTVVRLARAAAEVTPTTLMTSSWLLPPRTREVRCDEEWSFVAEGQKNCDPTEAADDHRGDRWGHVAPDPEHKLVLAVAPGARVAEDADEVVPRSRAGSVINRPRR